MTEQINDSENNHNELEFCLDLTTEILSAYVSNNPVSTSELPSLIQDVHAAVSKIVEENSPSAKQANLQKPAVPVKKSMHDDYLICLEDGKQFKSLKRHLSSHYGLSPDEYRQKWGLPSDYPMVAPNYAKARSRLAKEIGLGRKPGESPAKRG